MEGNVHPKEKIYFYIMSAISLMMYAAAVFFAPIALIYVPIIWAFRALLGTLALGYLRSNAIKVSEHQFPEIAAVAKEQCATLKMQMPDIYIMQGNGMLNAFATRIARRDMVMLYADVLEIAYQEGMDAVAFILGHELGHLYRKHVHPMKSLLIWPATFIPFLSNAYSRACEYTCDAIGYALCPQGATKGLLVLAAGKKLYAAVSVNALLANKEYEQGFAVWLAEIVSTHPPLLQRIAKVYQEDQQEMAMHAKTYMSAHIDRLKETQPGS